MVQIAAKKATYKDRYKSNLAKELIRTNKYNEIYNKIDKYDDEAYILDFKRTNEFIYNNIDMKEYLFLNLFNFCKPEELEQYLL
jgi:hypothetical protein